MVWTVSGLDIQWSGQSVVWTFSGLDSQWSGQSVVWAVSGVNMSVSVSETQLSVVTPYLCFCTEHTLLTSVYL